jgi:polar amino acid transport system substrate-binding protein
VKTRHAALAATAAALLLSACGSSDSSTSSDGGTDAGSGELALVSDGALTLCTNPPYEPFEYEQDGEIVGFDIALVAEVAADLGVELTTISTGFDGIQSGAALEAGTCDLVASAITITDERAANLDFSAPYWDADQAVLVAEGSDVADEADLEGLGIGVQQATTGSDWVTQEGLTGVEFEDLGLQVQALRNGQVEAAVNDVAALGPFTSEGLEVAFTIPTGEQYGFGVRQGNTALLEAVDGTLERVRTDGTYDALVAEYIGLER